MRLPTLTEILTHLDCAMSTIDPIIVRGRWLRHDRDGNVICCPLAAIILGQLGYTPGLHWTDLHDLAIDAYGHDYVAGFTEAYDCGDALPRLDPDPKWSTGVEHAKAVRRYLEGTERDPRR